MSMRSIYQDKVKTLMEEFGTQIEKLQSMTMVCDETDRRQIMSQIENLRIQHQTLQSKYQTLTSSKREVWEEIKPTVDDALEDVALSLNRTLFDFIERQNPIISH